MLTSSVITCLTREFYSFTSCKCLYCLPTINRNPLTLFSLKSKSPYGTRQNCCRPHTSCADNYLLVRLITDVFRRDTTRTIVCLLSTNQHFRLRKRAQTEKMSPPGFQPLHHVTYLAADVTSFALCTPRGVPIAPCQRSTQL